MKTTLSHIYYPGPIPKKSPKLNRLLSLPIFIIIGVVFLVAYGFWNMYNREYQRQIATVQPNMYENIKTITDSTNLLLNQSLTLGNIGIINRPTDHSFLVSDGNNVLLVVAPNNLDLTSVETASNTAQTLVLRGKYCALTPEVIKENKIPAGTSTVLQKQKYYLELTDSPEIKLEAIDPGLSDLTQNL